LPLDLEEERRAAGQRREMGIEALHILLHLRRRVALGIDGDEDRRKVCRRRSELGESLAHHGERGGARIGTIGVAEIDQHQFAAEIAVVLDDAILVAQREGTADRQRRPLGRAGRLDELGIGEAADDHDQRDDEGDQAIAGRGGHQWFPPIRRTI